MANIFLYFFSYYIKTQTQGKFLFLMTYISTL